MATPNMNLTLPTVGVTAGPTYAQQNNAALEAIDAHDHTSSKGVAVPTAGININANLDFNGYSPTGLESAVFGDVAGTPSNRSVYVNSGELFYKDSSGNAVQITNSGSVAGTPGSISNLATYESPPLTDRFPSVTFSDLARDFSFFYDTGLLAAMNTGDLRIYPYDGSFTSYTNFITLKSPTALGTNYVLTLPTALPADTNFIQVSSAGTLSFSNTITQPILAANGTAGAPSYSFSSDTNTGVYRSSADNLTLAAAGTNALTVSGSAVTAHLPLYANTGSVSAPTITFSSDTNTGFWLQTTDTIGVTAGGTQRLSIGSTISTNNTNLTVGTGSITATTSSLGTASATSINLSSGGAFKAAVYSGSIAATSSVNITPGGTIWGICGLGPYAGSTTLRVPIVAQGATTNSTIQVDGSSTNTTIVLYNSGGVSHTYRIIVFYT